jgi:hypothetical protein
LIRPEPDWNRSDSVNFLDPDFLGVRLHFYGSGVFAPVVVEAGHRTQADFSFLIIASFDDPKEESESG